MLTHAPPEHPHALKVRPKAIKQGAVVWDWIEEPPPERFRASQTKLLLFAMLDQLGAGRALRVNRREETLRSIITEYRKAHPELELSYRLRGEEPIRCAGKQPVYWCKLWRVK